MILKTLVISGALLFSSFISATPAEEGVPLLLEHVETLPGKSPIKTDLLTFKLKSKKTIEAIEEQALELYKFKNSPDIAGSYPMYDDILIIKPLSPWGNIDIKIKSSKGNEFDGFYIDRIAVNINESGEETLYFTTLISKERDGQAIIRVSHILDSISVRDGSQTLSVTLNKSNGFYEGYISNDIDVGDETLIIEDEPQIKEGDILMKDFVKKNKEKKHITGKIFKSETVIPSAIADDNVENPNVAQVLFLFDRRLLNVKKISYDTVRLKVIQSLELANNLLWEPQGYPSFIGPYKGIGIAKMLDPAYPAYKKGT